VRADGGVIALVPPCWSTGSARGSPLCRDTVLNCVWFRRRRPPPTQPSLWWGGRTHASSEPDDSASGLGESLDHQRVAVGRRAGLADDPPPALGVLGRGEITTVSSPLDDASGPGDTPRKHATLRLPVCGGRCVLGVSPFRSLAATTSAMHVSEDAASAVSSTAEPPRDGNRLVDVAEPTPEPQVSLQRHGRSACRLSRVHSYSDRSVCGERCGDERQKLPGTREAERRHSAGARQSCRADRGLLPRSCQQCG
jgi:hypothetical protein